MRLKELCTKDVAYCPRDMTVLQAARLMRRRHVGDLVVMNDAEDDPCAVGMITDRDIAVEVIGRDRDAGAVSVGEIMRAPLVTAGESEDSSVAIARMKEHGVRRLPITGEHDIVIGIVTLDDLLKQLRDEMDSLLDIVSKEQDRERRPP
jgi:CBS domain-containing protein